MCESGAECKVTSREAEHRINERLSYELDGEQVKAMAKTLSIKPQPFSLGSGAQLTGNTPQHVSAEDKPPPPDHAKMSDMSAGKCPPSGK